MPASKYSRAFRVDCVRKFNELKQQNPSLTYKDFVDIADLGIPYDTFRNWTRSVDPSEEIETDESLLEEGVEWVKNGGETYKYIEAEDQYVFVLSGWARPIPIAGSVVRDLQHMYSDAGGGHTINECALSLQLPRPVVKKILRAVGTTHDSLPFTREEMLSEEFDEELAVEQLLQERTLRVYNKANQLKWRDIKKDAEKWNNLEISLVRPLMQHIERFSRKYKPPKLDIYPRDTAGLMMVTTPGELHYGKYGRIGDHIYNRQVARDTLLRTTEKMLNRASREGVSEICAILGNDFLHVDVRGATTKGTPQDCDGLLHEIWEGGAELSIEWIDMLRSLAPVRCISALGNHARQNEFTLTHYIAAWFRECPDVQVYIDGELRQYMSWGENLIVGTHGDTVKEKDIIATIAAEAPELWSRCPNRYIFVGHTHQLEAKQLRGARLLRTPTLSGSDQWHRDYAWIGSDRGMAYWLLHKNEGLVSISPVRAEV